MQQVIPLIKQGYLSRFLLIIVGYCIALYYLRDCIVSRFHIVALEILCYA